MKIGIFGGSFNPIHKGHVQMMNVAIKELNLDKLIIVPAHKSPFKAKTDLVSDDLRVSMIEKVLPEKAEISLFEINRKGISYTIDTVKYLKNKYKNDELYLVMGSDNLLKLDKWKNIEELSKLAKITVLKRTKSVNKINIKKYNGLLIKNDLYEASSTNFKRGNLDSVEDSVIEIIGKNFLYAKELVHNTLSAKRAKHCLATATFAAELAKKHGLSAKKAYYAGLFHDIAKEWDPEVSINFINHFENFDRNISKHELHQTAGYVWLKHYYQVQDPEIEHSVLVHTTLDDFSNKELNWLDKVVYISDKICEGRKFSGIQKLRELAFNDLEAGFKAVVTYVYNFEKYEKQTKFTPRQEEIYNKYINKG
ncbi:nicotinate-nucleotide adenylyltransferase [Mycoplasma sp. Ms02]|uniref:nicotinate-nucleotide adenylyltransferase n=1 Tax=Mycoplasma sp. Ms02 TaxID=353851 RepID=UPI001C89766F|nr:nicotinate-nucleotide adenylyltransferase [Mycoplasma sp. Ms02]QZE12404.1 nicotinate-nucleotide adenylyltransferase [Mycoplasma sp. Ms02]